MSVLANIYAKLFAPASHSHAKSDITDLSGIIGFPNYAGRTALSEGTAVTFDGWVAVTVRVGTPDEDTVFGAGINVNGVTVCSVYSMCHNGAIISSGQLFLPVKTGDYVTVTGSKDVVELLFFPLR